MKKYLYAYEYISIWCLLLLLIVSGVFVAARGNIMTGLLGTSLFGYGAYLLARRLKSLSYYIHQRLLGVRPTDAIGVGRLILVPYLFLPALAGAILYEIVMNRM